jgi:hypothetical protein
MALRRATAAILAPDTAQKPLSRAGYIYLRSGAVLSEDVAPDLAGPA